MQKKHWLIIALVALLATVLGIIFICTNTPNDLTSPTEEPEQSPGRVKSYAFSTIYRDGMYYPILNEQFNGDPIKVSGEQTCADGSVTCVLSTSDELILFTLSQRKTIATDVDRFKLDDEGKTIIYSSKNKVLYRYDVGTGNEETVLNSFYKYTVSADFTTIAYINDAKELRIKTGDRDKLIAVVEASSYVVGVSNDANHIYTQSGGYKSEVLYHYDSNGQRTEIIQADGFELFPQYGSATQFIISPYTGPTYVSMDGQSAVKMADYWIEPLLCVNRTEGPDEVLNWPYRTAQGEIWYISDDPLNPTVLVQDAMAAKCDPTGRYIWYIKDNNLLRLDVQDGANAENNAVVIIENLIDLTMEYPSGSTYYNVLDLFTHFSNDCKQVYYTYRRTLYMADAMTGGAKLIDDNVLGGFTLLNGIFYYQKDTVLYALQDGVVTQLLTDVDTIGRADPNHLYAQQGNSYYIADGTNSYTLTIT